MGIVEGSRDGIGWSGDWTRERPHSREHATKGRETRERAAFAGWHDKIRGQGTVWGERGSIGRVLAGRPRWRRSGECGGAWRLICDGRVWAGRGPGRPSAIGQRRPQRPDEAGAVSWRCPVHARQAGPGRKSGAGQLRRHPPVARSRQTPAALCAARRYLWAGGARSTRPQDAAGAGAGTDGSGLATDAGRIGMAGRRGEWTGGPLGEGRGGGRQSGQGRGRQRRASVQAGKDVMVENGRNEGIGRPRPGLIGQRRYWFGKRLGIGSVSYAANETRIPYRAPPDLGSRAFQTRSGENK